MKWKIHPRWLERWRHCLDCNSQNSMCVIDQKDNPHYKGYKVWILTCQKCGRIQEISGEGVELEPLEEESSMQIKVTKSSPPQPQITLAHLKPESLAYCYGHIFLKTYENVICLSDLKHSISANISLADLATPLPVGAVVSLEVTEPSKTGDPQMKVTVTKPEEKKISIKDMPSGSIGVTDNGLHYYKTFVSAVCFEDPAKSYNYVDSTTTLVTLLPIGTTLTITI